jgi:hypothetical protein
VDNKGLTHHSPIWSIRLLVSPRLRNSSHSQRRIRVAVSYPRKSLEESLLGLKIRFVLREISASDTDRSEASRCITQGSLNNLGKPDHLGKVGADRKYTKSSLK